MSSNPQRLLYDAVMKAITGAIEQSALDGRQHVPQLSEANWRNLCASGRKRVEILEFAGDCLLRGLIGEALVKAFPESSVHLHTVSSCSLQVI